MEKTQKAVLDLMRQDIDNVKFDDLDTASVVIVEFINALVDRIVFKDNPVDNERILNMGIDMLDMVNYGNRKYDLSERERKSAGHFEVWRAVSEEHNGHGKKIIRRLSTLLLRKTEMERVIQFTNYKKGNGEWDNYVTSTKSFADSVKVQATAVEITNTMTAEEKKNFISTYEKEMEKSPADRVALSETDTIVYSMAKKEKDGRQKKVEQFKAKLGDLIDGISKGEIHKEDFDPKSVEQLKDFLNDKETKKKNAPKR